MYSEMNYFKHFISCIPPLEAPTERFYNFFFPFVVKNQKNACRIRPTSAISDTHYLELSLCRTFCLVPSTFSIISLINPFAISNSAILNFHHVKLSRSLQWFLGCFPAAVWNIWMRFSNESYSSFQAFEC